MREARSGLFPAECLVQHIVKRQGGQPLLSADYLGDLHQVVIHDVGQVICRQLIRAFPKDFVVQSIGVDFNMPADQVVHRHHGVLGHLETDGPVGGLTKQPCGLLFAQCQGIAQRKAGLLVIGESLSARLRCTAYSLELLRGVECVICISVRDQLLGILAVDAAPLALPVGRVRMALRRRLYDAAVGVHSLVGSDPAPFQCLDDVFLGSGYEAVGVGILDAEDEVSSALFCKQVVVERRADPAHMQGAGR